MTPICLVVISKSHSVCAISRTAALFSLTLVPPSMCLVSAVESVRKTAFSTSTPTRLPHLASVTRQATGHLRRPSVSQIIAVCVCICLCVFKKRMNTVYTRVVFQNRSLVLVTTHKQNLLYLCYYLLHLSSSHVNNITHE